MKDKIEELLTMDLGVLNLDSEDTYVKKGAVLFSWPKHNRYRVLINYYPCTFTVDGLTFHSVEQYYHFKRLSVQRYIDKLMSYTGDDNAKWCYRYVRNPAVKRTVEMDKQKRWQYIWEGLVYKTTVCPEFVDRLLESGDKTIVEHITWNARGDIFGAKEVSETERDTLVGYNALGKMLMFLRQWLRDNW